MSCMLSLVSGGDTRYNDVRALVWTLPLNEMWASDGMWRTSCAMGWPELAADYDTTKLAPMHSRHLSINAVARLRLPTRTRMSVPSRHPEIELKQQSPLSLFHPCTELVSSRRTQLG